MEAEIQMSISGAAVLDSALYLAQSVENLANPYDSDAERLIWCPHSSNKGAKAKVQHWTKFSG